MLRQFLGALFAIACIAPTAHAAEGRATAPAGARVYFIEPADGATVSGEVTVKFGLQGMGVAPAGIQVPNTGHHHLLIDADLPEDLSKPLPNDEHHRHFGAGQTETTIKLAPGKHTLRLVLGDALHVPFDPPVVSAPITITVK